VAIFDGEEAFVKWETNDQTYGSRHQAAKWQQDGSLATIEALINIDMIGARDLKLTWELNSTRELRDLVWQVAERCGYSSRFPNEKGAYMGDDHVPFVRAGVPAVDLIDLEYGPDNGFWHTVEDTPDKLSAHSFGMIAHVLVEVLRELGIVKTV
jgi:Zn-dependent M28 family amino/carboxypeptidase